MGDTSRMQSIDGRNQHRVAHMPLFDPNLGQVVFSPENSGSGSWVGAPSVLQGDDGRIYMNYRLRKPIQQGRGNECRIAVSDDGVTFEDVWSLKKEKIDTPSIERQCLVRAVDGTYLLYISYVDPNDNRWRIDVLHSGTPAEFSLSTLTPALTAHGIGEEGVKDPFVLTIGRQYYLLAGYGPTEGTAPNFSAEDLHGTGNCFATGRITHPSGLARSPDGVNWTWLGQCLPVGKGEAWDRGMARVSSVFYDPPVYYVFYDGRQGRNDPYTGKTGLATGETLHHLSKVSLDGPLLVSPEGPHGGLRYVDTLRIGDRQFFYYEYERSDESHDLRVSIVDQ